MTSAATGPKLPARERLLNAASELFYAEGVQSVGIDRVIERAGVAKASLYSTFGSKEELVYAYLEARHVQTLGRLKAAAAAAGEDPVDKINAVFAAQAELFRDRDFRGCAFNAASAEAPAGSKIDIASRSYRDDVFKLFRDLSAQAGAADPDALAAQLQLVYDGSGMAAKSTGSDAIYRPAQGAVRALVAAALS